MNRLCCACKVKRGRACLDCRKCTKRGTGAIFGEREKKCNVM